jgi:hypothetical protein
MHGESTRTKVCVNTGDDPGPASDPPGKSGEMSSHQSNLADDDEVVMVFECQAQVSGGMECRER